MAKLRRPHVVPAGYQRNFADGERIKIIEKATKNERTVGVRDNFVASHFLAERETTALCRHSHAQFSEGG